MNTYVPTDPIAPGIFVVRVTDEVAARLISTQGEGVLSLVYRDAEAADYEGVPQTSLEALCSGTPDAGDSTVCQSIGATGSSVFEQ